CACVVGDCCPAPAPPAIYTLSLHDALPIYAVELGAGAIVLHGEQGRASAAAGLSPRLGSRPNGPGIGPQFARPRPREGADRALRSEEHTSELQSREKLVCRLLLEKKKRRRA